MDTNKTNQTSNQDSDQESEPSFIKRYYHVIITACCFFILFLNTGLPSTSFNVYQSYLVQLDGVGDFGGSLIVTVRTFVSLVAIFFVGAYYKRINLHIGVIIASLLTSIGFLIYGFADSVEVFCLGSLFTGLGYGLGGMVATTVLIGNWFRGRVGTIAGITSMGSSFASIIIPLAAAALIKSTNLSTTFVCESILAFVITFFLLIFLRSKPADLGIAPTEERADSEGASKDKVHVGTSTIPAHYRHIMMVAVFLLGAANVVGYTYFSVLLSSSGIDLGTTALLTSMLGLCLTISKLSTGWIFDRIGARVGSAIFFLLMILGLGFCGLVPIGQVPVAIAAAVLFGIGSSLATTGLSIWSLELSDGEHRMRLVKNFQVAYAFGGFIFNLVPGIIAEATGSYAVNYLIFMIFSIVCAILVMSVYRKKTT